MGIRCWDNGRKDNCGMHSPKSFEFQFQEAEYGYRYLKAKLGPSSQVLVLDESERILLHFPIEGLLLRSTARASQKEEVLAAVREQGRLDASAEISATPTTTRCTMLTESQHFTIDGFRHTFDHRSNTARGLLIGRIDRPLERPLQL
ncbi:uncharacterized protein MYCFIDRAFT_172965 [Pseudocercospora fijiensis CIRAD86]|uniref:Uncharacterized protein n=1 Tax=Pseudocercospora fijiensis (strain CIRAD86) TaxID=383855 RepID=M2Z243_PSEFD|nr:uncharacterized protein MYCFIDRAFT_172965 [Pseudocercospora fijiensis CIRAD86]EME83890.1 hypothetical protein MYCFIDRAFT_172965 [Pseudocercospora fijiensis CIRAD86]